MIIIFVSSPYLGTMPDVVVRILKTPISFLAVRLYCFQCHVIFFIFCCSSKSIVEKNFLTSGTESNFCDAYIYIYMYLDIAAYLKINVRLKHTNKAEQRVYQWFHALAISTFFPLCNAPPPCISWWCGVKVTSHFRGYPSGKNSHAHYFH